MRPESLFDGPLARLTARVMARQNLEAEREAVDILAPKPDDHVVAIGVGAGVGVEILASRARWVLAVDPSQVMVESTIGRNRAAVAQGRVVVERTTAARLPLAEAGADGAIAVNSIQLWEPLDGSLAEVARVLRPGARLVTLTHDWAIPRSTGLSVADWLDHVDRTAHAVGLGAMRSWRATAERGGSVALELTRLDTR